MEKSLKDRLYVKFSLLGISLLFQELIFVPAVLWAISKLPLTYSFTGLFWANVVPTVLRSTIPLLPLYILYRREIAPLYRRVKMPFAGLCKATAATIGSTHIVYLFAVLITMFLAKLGFQSSTLDLNMERSMSETVINLILLVLVAPLVEEFMFRGVIFGMLRQHGAGFAIVASGLLFGMYHGNFLQALPNTVTGIFLSYVVWETGSIFPAMAIHAFNNGLAGLGMIVPLVETVVSWLWVAFMFYALYVWYQAIRDNRFPPRFGSRKDWQTLFFNPVMVVWFALYLYQIGLSMFGR